MLGREFLRIPKPPTQPKPAVSPDQLMALGLTQPQADVAAIRPDLIDNFLPGSRQLTPSERMARQRMRLSDAAAFARSLARGGGSSAGPGIVAIDPLARILRQNYPRLTRQQASGVTSDAIQTATTERQKRVGETTASGLPAVGASVAALDQGAFAPFAQAKPKKNEGPGWLSRQLSAIGRVLHPGSANPEPIADQPLPGLVFPQPHPSRQPGLRSPADTPAAGRPLYQVRADELRARGKTLQQIVRILRAEGIIQ